MLRRWGSAFVLSIAVHLAVVGGVVGALIWSGLTFSVPIDVDVVGMRMDEVHDLPLGPPPGASDPRPSAAPRVRKRVAKAPAADGELAAEKPAKKDEAGAETETPPESDAASRVSRLEQYGPEGSRVTALLRLDRLRGTPYVPALDAILGRLPDRRDLLDGTGLDLFQTFDALLIATPNPLDYTVTFLAARHHLKDGELRAALDRGARATGRALDWRTEGRRPFAERHGRHAAPGATRDERLIVMPAPGLVVVTPPVYRPLLLAMARPRRAAAAAGGHDAGGDAGTGTAVVGEAAAGSAAAGGGAVAHEADGQWGALLRRIDAEDGIMPEGAVAMISATDLFGVRNLARGIDPGSRAGQPAPGAKPARQPTGTIAGMEVPRVITVSIGVDPSPFLDVIAEFDDEDQARHWERDWPALHHRLATHPYVVLTGFSALVARAELSRTDTTVHLRETATDAETLRLLQIVARFIGVEPIASP
jgi:hypothetical protein